MNVTVNSQRLATELRLLNRIVPAKPAIAILSYALFRAEGETLGLYATDTEVGLSADCPAGVGMPGSVVLPVARFLALVEQFPDADVVITLEKSQVVVRCGTFKSRMQTMVAADFPAPPSSGGTVVTLGAVALRALIDKTRYAVSATASKFVLKGALLTLQGQVAAMVATDSKRLAIATAPRSGPDLSVVVPVKTLDLLASQLSEGDVELTAGPQHLFFSVSGRLLISRTIDGTFPSYERIIPRSNGRVVTADRHALTSALKRVVLISEENRAIYIDLTADTAELTSSSAEVGSAAEMVRVSYSGEPMKICVNGRYLLDFLDVAVNQNVSIALKDTASAALLTDGVDHVGVIMLMRS